MNITDVQNAFGRKEAGQSPRDRTANIVMLVFAVVAVSGIVYLYYISLPKINIQKLEDN